MAATSGCPSRVIAGNKQSKPLVLVRHWLGNPLLVLTPKRIGIEVVVIQPNRKLEAVIAVVFHLVPGFVLRDEQHGKLVDGVEEPEPPAAAGQEWIAAGPNLLLRPFAGGIKFGAIDTTHVSQ